MPTHPTLLLKQARTNPSFLACPSPPLPPPAPATSPQARDRSRNQEGMDGVWRTGRRDVLSPPATKARGRGARPLDDAGDNQGRMCILASQLKMCPIHLSVKRISSTTPAPNSRSGNHLRLPASSLLSGYPEMARLGAGPTTPPPPRPSIGSRSGPRRVAAPISLHLPEMVRLGAAP
uniref:Uncharacterized protein n=2 Tax=Triticum urartu TaxID=4572 RepID=A0A8R7PEA9_TRIUA